MALWKKALGFIIGKTIIEFQSIFERIWSNYHLYIIYGSIIFLMLIILGQVSEWRKEKKRKQFDEQSRKSDKEKRSDAVSDYPESMQKMEEGGLVNSDTIKQLSSLQLKGKPGNRDTGKQLSSLQLNRKNVIMWSLRYDDRFKGTHDERTEARLKNVLQNQRYLDKPDFIELCMWKSPRPKRHYESNHHDLVKKITKTSFTTENEDQQITKLMELQGVSWAVASAILHFAFPDKYPILDFRVIWSLG